MSPIKNFWCRISLVALLTVALPSVATSNSSDPVQTPDRVVAIGDIHGEFEGFTSILRASELVDDSDRWIGGTAFLVQTGDYMDRGPDVRKVMDLLMDLQEQAAAAGGQVIVLMGNHESMNLLYDYRDVTDEIFASFATDESDKLREEAYKTWVQWMRELARTRGQVPPKLGKDKKEAWMNEHPPGYIEYERAIGPNGAYGKWLLERPVAARVGNTLYMHAGLSEDYVGSSIEEINQLNWDEIRTYQADRVSLDKAGLVPKFFNLQEFNSALYYYSNNPPEKRFANRTRQQLVQTASDHLNEMQKILVEDSPLWYRGYTNLDDAQLEEHVARLKKSYGVEHFVVAHSPLMSGRIHQRLNGTVFLIDTGMLTSYYKGRASALEFDHGRFSAIYQDRRVVLRESESAKEAVPASASADHSAFRGRLQPVPAVWKSVSAAEIRPASYPPQAEAGAPSQTPKRVFYDVEGNPLPFQTPAEVEDFLSSAKMVAKEDIPIGITKPIKITLEGNGVKVHAKFSSVNQSGTNEKLADGSVEMYFLDSYKSDLAAYELSKMLGMESVPPAVERQIERKDGIVQIWIENLTSYDSWIKEGNTGQPSSIYLRRQVKDMRTFDLLIRNTDRHRANIMWDPSDNLWLIDNTRSLARNPKLREGEEFEGCSRDLYNAINSLDAKEVKKQLKPYLGTFEINALMKRRDQLIKLIDKEIKQKGENEVLFNYGDPPPGMVIKQSSTASRLGGSDLIVTR